MNRAVVVPCPYCGKGNVVEVQSDTGQMSTVCCDFMEGGCDKWYVARIKVDIVATPLKIEEGGEGDG